MQQQQRGYALALGAGCVWALTSPGIKYLLDTYGIGGLTLAFWRDAFAAFALLVAIGVLRPGLLRVTPRELGRFALVGAISIGFYHAIWVWSIALNGAAVAIVLIYTYPIWVTLGAWLLWGERPSAAQFMALGLSLLGCALLVRVYDPALLRLSWLGAVIGVLCALVHSLYVLFNQRAVARHSPWTALAYGLLFGALALAFAQPPARTFDVGPGVMPWLGLALLGIGPTLVGYGLFTASLRYLPGRVSSLLSTIEVPVSVLVAVVWIGERLDWPQLLGMACVLFAVVLPSLRWRQPPLVPQGQAMAARAGRRRARRVPRARRADRGRKPARRRG